MPRWTGLLFAVALVTACASGSDSSDSQGLDAALADASGGAGECSGAANGSPCGVADESSCDRADICVDGQCVDNFSPAGTACGDQVESDCSAADSCDGEGRCAPNHVAAEAPCGDPTDSVCDRADSCDGEGSCLANYEAADVPCGDPAATTCSAPDACDGAGACATHDAADGTTCTECEEGPDWCAGCSVGACPNLCGATTDVTTTFTGTNGLYGNMFDIVAKRDLRITGFDLHLAVGSHNVSIYTKPDSYVGFEQDQLAWTLLGGTAVESVATGEATPVPIAIDLFVAEGERVAFYVKTGGTSMKYSNAPSGGAVGDVFAFTGDIDVLLGSGNGSNFDTVFAPRGFNGRVYYRVCE